MHEAHQSALLLSVSAGLLFWSGCGGAPAGEAAEPDHPISVAPGPSDETTEPAVAGLSPAVPDQFIVTTLPGSEVADLEGLFDEARVEALEQRADLAAWLVGFDEERREEVRALLSGSALVESVLENRLYTVESVPDDPRFADQWHLDAIEAPAAWDRTTGSAQMPVAVVDTGVESGHPDLLGKVLPGVNLWQNSADSGDVHGHGTMVAGVLAGMGNNGLGVAPVAWLNPVVPVRVASDDGNSSSWILAAGIQWASTAGAKVINVSFAPLQDDEIVVRQCRLARLAGSLVVISAGNSGAQADGEGSDSALFVGATDPAHKRAGFSTYGDFVDLAAPGSGIWTTKVQGQYGSASGTSFAAPVVAGVAALVWSVNPSFRPSTVRAILLATAVDGGAPGEDPELGAGLVNAAAAVEMARGVVLDEDRAAPTVAISSPANGAILSAPVAVSVTASDNDEVAEVTLYVDAQPLAADLAAPYQFLLNPGRFAPGTHEVKAIAADVSGNTAEAKMTLIFQGPPDATRPTVRMISPANGAEVSGVITLRADVVDNRSVATAEVLVDGAVIGTVRFQEAGAQLAFNWDASTASPGEHTLSVRATDSSGNTSMASVRVTVR